MRPSAWILLLAACAEPPVAPHADTGALARDPAIEVCNGLDDDGDDRVDEGIDVDHDGISDCLEDPCEIEDGRLWYSTDAAELAWYEPATGRHHRVGRMLGDVTDIGFGPGGRLWAVERGGRLLEIHPDNATTKIRGLAPARSADAMGLDAAGRAFTADGAQLRVLRADPFAPTTVVSLARPWAVRDTTWHQHRLYAVQENAANPALHGLFRVDVGTGAVQQRAKSPGRGWSGVTSRSDGTLWAIDRFRLDRVDPSTGLVAPQATLSAIPSTGGRVAGTPNGLTSRTACSDCFEALCDIDDERVWYLASSGPPWNCEFGSIDLATGAVLSQLILPITDPMCNVAALGISPAGELVTLGLGAAGPILRVADLDARTLGAPWAVTGGPGLTFDAAGRSWVHGGAQTPPVIVAEGGGAAQSWAATAAGAPLRPGGDVAWSDGDLIVAGVASGIAGLYRMDLSIPGVATSPGPVVTGSFSGVASTTTGRVAAVSAGGVYEVDLRTGGSRLVFDHPGMIFDLAGAGDLCQSIREVCNGLDDDSDGLVDEDTGDTDDDGVVDCMDVEVCDGLDNDGDGFVDEGMPDTDLDGTADCVDVEVCNGVDDDGDGVVDNSGRDVDEDGVDDCDDVERCDGADNDGDGAVDEGYDLDGDSLPDCREGPCQVDDPSWWFSTVDGVLKRFHPATGVTHTVGPTWPGLVDLAWSPDGVLYGVDAVANLVTLDPATGEGGVDRSIGADASGLVVDPAGTIWIGYAEALKRIDATGDATSWDSLGVEVTDVAVRAGVTYLVTWDALNRKSWVHPFDATAGALLTGWAIDGARWTGGARADVHRIAVASGSSSRYLDLTTGAWAAGPTHGAPAVTGLATRYDACPPPSSGVKGGQ